MSENLWVMLVLLGLSGYLIVTEPSQWAKQRAIAPASPSAHLVSTPSLPSGTWYDPLGLTREQLAEIVRQAGTVDQNGCFSQGVPVWTTHFRGLPEHQDGILMTHLVGNEDGLQVAFKAQQGQFTCVGFYFAGGQG